MDLVLPLVGLLVFVGIMLLVAGALCYLPYVVVKETLREAVFLRRMRQLKASRPDEGIEHFARYFAMRDVPERIARVTHGFLALNVAKTEGFPVRPVDSLAEVYNIGGPGGMPLEDLIRDVASRCDVLVQPSLLVTLPVTVSDLVLQVANLHRTRERDREARLLLRPSAAPDAGMLLRPAQGTGDTDARRLLRPALPEEQA